MAEQGKRSFTDKVMDKADNLAARIGRRLEARDEKKARKEAAKHGRTVTGAEERGNIRESGR
jgi:hypothetical protein